MKHKIAAAGNSDIADLIRLGDETNLSPWSAQNYIDEFRLANSIIIKMVDDDNALIGFVCGRIINGGEGSFEGEIYNIAVSESSRREGFGQVLLDEFLAELRKHAGKVVWLEVRESNAAAIAFYRKNGFENVQTRPNFYSNPTENALLMRLDMTTDGGNAT